MNENWAHLSFKMIRNWAIHVLCTIYMELVFVLVSAIDKQQTSSLSIVQSTWFYHFETVASPVFVHFEPLFYLDSPVFYHFETEVSPVFVHFDSSDQNDYMYR